MPADKAIKDGSIEPLQKLLASTAQEGIRKNFEHVVAKRNFSKDDITAGREYVEAYVEFIHFIERIYEASASPAHGHYPVPEEGSMPKQGH